MFNSLVSRLSGAGFFPLVPIAIRAVATEKPIKWLDNHQKKFCKNKEEVFKIEIPVVSVGGLSEEFGRAPLTREGERETESS
jgi:hypothetical protein